MKKVFLGVVALASVLAIVTIASGQIPESNKIRLFLGLQAVSAENPLPVTASDGSGPLTVDGSVNIGTFPDNEPFDLVRIAGASISLGAKTGALSFPIVLPTDLFGQKVMASSVPVTLSSDQPAIPVSGTITANAGTGTFVVGDGGLTLSIDDNGTSITVDGTVTSNAGTGTFIIGDGGLTLSIDDNASSITVDGTVTANAGTGTFRTDPTGVTTQPVSGTITANAGTGTFIVGDGGLALSIDDNGSSITVDGDMGLTSNDADLDSDAGTDNHEVVAIGLPGSGGHVLGGTATAPLRTDPTGSTTQPVSGTLSISSFPDNEPFNLVQIAGGAISLGAKTGALSFPIVLPTDLFGQKVMASSVPVTLSSDQPAVPVSGTITANAGTGTFRTDPTGVTTQPVSGTITANAGTGTFNVGDGGLALSIDDNGASITVDGTVTNIPTVATRGTYTATFSVAAQIGTFLDINGPPSGRTEIIEIFIAKPTSNARINLKKRSTVATGGTSTSRTATSHDSTSSSAQSFVRQFTADPAEGVLIGEVRAPMLLLTTETMTWTWENSLAKPLTLRTNTQSLTIETDTAATIEGHIMWTEG